MSENEPREINLRKFEAKIFQTINQIETIRIDKDDFRQQIFIGLSLSILERSHSIVLLAKDAKYFDAKILLRSTLEHFVDLKNLVADDSYQLHFQKPFLKGMAQKLREAEKGNPFFARIEREIPIPDELENISSKLDEVNELGGEELRIWQKFERAGMRSEYESQYRSLSNQSHPTYSGIIERHFDVDNKTGDFSIHGFRRASGATSKMIVDTAYEIIELTADLISSFQPNSK